MIGNLYQVTLNEGLSPAERSEVFNRIGRIKGVTNKDAFNDAAKISGDKFFVHSLGNKLDEELRHIKGVKNVYQMPVA